MIGLALDPATGSPRISYYKQEPFGFTGLRSASYNGASWDISTVEAIVPLSGQKLDGRTSLVLDPITGYPRIAYDNSWDVKAQGLRIARWDGTQWNIQVVGIDWSAVGNTSALRTSVTGKLQCLFFYGPWRILALWKEP